MTSIRIGDRVPEVHDKTLYWQQLEGLRRQEPSTKYAQYIPRKKASLCPAAVQHGVYSLQVCVPSLRLVYFEGALVKVRISVYGRLIYIHMGNGVGAVASCTRTEHACSPASVHPATSRQRHQCEHHPGLTLTTIC